MRKQGLVGYVKFILAAVLLASAGAGTVNAVSSTSNSNSYQVTETEFGSGSSNEGCSTQYCAKASIGGMTAGSSSSANHKATFGPITSSDPLLEVIVNANDSDVGVLSAERTATKTMTVQVRSYLSDGYSLQIVGSPPKVGNHTLSTPKTPTAAHLGVEQFAINAVANTVPKVGANPVQGSTNPTSFGVVNDNYRTPNLFQYISGDEVAHSDSSTGQTQYTISMILNVSNATPAGQYASDFAVVVTPYY